MNRKSNDFSIVRLVYISFLLLLPSLLLSQNNGITLEGKVTDQTGKPIPYVNVYLKGYMKGSMSDENGKFKFIVDKHGVYTLVASHIGYETYEKTIQIRTEEAIFIEITLREKTIEEEMITITASAFTGGEGKGVTLTPLEVVLTPGAAADVFGAIKTFPGIQTISEGSGLFVRGGDVSETAVILDGAYINHPYRYESPNGGYFGMISPFLLKGIFFSSGGFSVEYGNALSGILDMKSLDLPYEKLINIGVGLAALSTMIKLPIKPDKVGISMSGNYSDTRHLFKLNGHTYRFSQYPKAYDINLNLMYQYSSKGRLKLFLFREKNDIGIEVKHLSEAFYEGDNVTNFVNLSWQDLIASKFLLSGNIAYTNFAKKQKLDAFLDLLTDERLHQIRLKGEYQISNNMVLQSGIELFRDDISYKGRFQFPDEETSGSETIKVDANYKAYRLAFYSQLQVNFSTKLSYVIGFRYERHSKSNQQLLDPRSSLSLKLKNNWDLVFSIGQYHQFPEPVFFDPVIGNPDLKAMKSWHYILGLVHHSESTILRIELYYKDYKNLLINDQKLNYVNQGYGFSKGLDFFLKRDWEFFKVRISYSYLEAKRKWMDAPKLSPTKFDIPHNFTVVAQLNLTRLNIGMLYQYAAGKPYTSEPNQYHDKRTPSYQRLDISLSYLFNLIGNGIDVFYLAISNVLGRENILDYIYSPDYKKPVPIKSVMLRSFYFGISISL
ncbi:TonB-dependent receptor [Candidatus Kryptobacter tengchongensis]|uniref:Outer membrane cobalamin receptor protein n=1 Tax=Kryptobacter tengchongensis TaxID=1643429 RepID=A0A916LI63_KRYT1|nr:TonB-dependent receptor [Candidatus Kryptobacter tengchongensis]CUS97238.1 Outer membrane cobalamin receptor protein [Candidatus Kryptobacter tengchongensis]